MDKLAYMNKIIRHSVWESNSSSSHAISCNSKSNTYESITPDENGQIILNGGQFGWEWDKFNDALTKANYCAVAIKSTHSLGEGKEEWFVELLKEHTGAQEIIFNFSTEDWDSANHSYIDHQSLEDTGKAVDKIFESRESLKQFIFAPDSWLFLGNDNTSAPPNFYDVGSVKYTHELKLDGNKTPYFLKEGEEADEVKLYDFLRVLWQENEENEYADREWVMNSPKKYRWPSYGGTQDQSWDFSKHEIYPVIEEPTYAKDKGKKFLGYEEKDRIILKFQIKKLDN